jgi:hypothetical protein
MGDVIASTAVYEQKLTSFHNYTQLSIIWGQINRFAA